MRILPVLLFLSLPLFGANRAARAQAPLAERCIQLLLSGDVDGVRVREAVERAWPYHARRGDPKTVGRVDLLDAAGRLVHRIPWDLSHFNLHRDDRKGKTLVVGDHIHDPQIESLVKIPDLGARVVRLRFDYRDGLRTRTLGEISLRELRAKIALGQAAQPQMAPIVRTHVNNGPVANRYDIVVLGDGYRSSEQTKFYADVDRWQKDLFAREPYKRYEKYFNVHSVFRASVESGADQPDVSPPITKNTVYDASYNIGNTPRCLYIRNTSLASSDAKLAPDVEGRIVVFVNDSRYGGCASTFSVSYNGSSGPVVQSHEFGHSFGGLADEYDYGRSGTYSGNEPGQANITKDSTGKAKWPLWLGHNGVGAFEGAGYYKKGLFRPKSNCLMRSLGAPLCEVCIEELAKKSYVTVDPIEKPQPTQSSVQVTQPQTLSFSFDDLVPGGAEIEWFVGNQRMQQGGESFLFASAGWAPGNHVVRVEVRDPTGMVRSDPGSLLESSRSWTVRVLAGTPGSAGTVPKGFANVEGNTRYHPVFHNSPGRAQYFYRKNMLPHASQTRTLRGMRLRPDAANTTEAFRADIEVALGSQGIPFDTLSTQTFAQNQGTDHRVAFARKTVDWPAVPKPASGPFAFVSDLKFDQAQVLTGEHFCIDISGWTAAIETHEWFLDAQRDIDYGNKQAFGTGCPANASFDSAGHYVGGVWRTWGYLRQAPSSTSVAIAWLGLQRAFVPVPGTNCTQLAQVFAFHGQPQLITTNDGYVSFTWGLVPFVIRGVKLSVQCLSIDPSFNAVGFRFSPAVEVTIGTGFDLHSVYGYAQANRPFDPRTDRPGFLAEGSAAIFELY